MKKIGLLFTVVLYALVGYAQLPVTNWQNTFGNASGNARVTSTATDANGNVYVAGYFFGSVDMDFGAGQANITSSGQYDAFIAKYNAFGDFTWVRRIGGTQGDQVNAIFLDNSGGLHVTGFFQGTTSIFASNGTFNLTSVGGADIFMLYFDGAGTLIRNFRIGGTGDESGLAIKADINSNVYLAGTIGSANVNFNVYGGSQLISSSGALDGFIAKYDFSYAAQWVQRVGGGTVDDAINDLDVDVSGNAYVVGTYRGAATFSGTSITLANSGNTDAFISKLNGSGTFLWARKVGSTGADAINNIRLNGKGAAYIAGHFSNACNLNPNGTAQNFTSLGSTDIFVAKVDTNLATANWIKPMGGTGNDLMYGLAIDTNDNVYTTGQFESTAEFPIGISSSSLASGGVTDGFVSKLSSLGNYVWSTRFGTSTADLGWDIEVSKNGNSVIVGGNQGTNAYFTQLGACNLAGPITGLTNVCNTTSITYSIAAVTGATSYVWTLPSGWTGTSSTNSITVTPAANGGIISVAPVTSCGVGVAQSKTVVYGLNTIDVNLVRHWIADSADNNRDRINSFLLTLNNAAKDTDRFGTPDAAYRISGGTGFIGTGTNLPTGNTSIAFWYYYQKNGGSNNIILGSNTGTVPAGHPLLLTDNNSELLYPWSNTGGPIGSGIVFTPNTWHHIALARNGSSFTLYLNGTQVATGTNLATTNFDRIGNNRPGFETQGATGKFDEIRMYNVQLNASQVQNIYNFGQVRRLNISQVACSGSTAQHNIHFSASGTNYQWFKNTQAAGNNSSTYANTFANGDTLIQVRAENQCVAETYGKSYVVNNPQSTNVNITTCGYFQVGSKKYLTTGIYKDTLKTINGCDSIVTLNLNIDNSTSFNRNQGMMHYWPLNSGDSSTSYKDLTLLNYIGSVTRSDDRAGNVASAYTITNSLQGFVPSTPLTYPEITIAFWYKRTNTVAGALLVNQNSSVLSVNANGTLIHNGSTSTFALTLNQWHYIVYTNNPNGGVANIYVDGQLVLNQAGNVFPVTRIGSLTNGLSPALGSYDDIMVFNYALSGGEVDSLSQLPTIVSSNIPSTISAQCGYTLNTKVTNKAESVVELYKNNQLLANDTFAVVNNFSINDSVITIRLYRNCMRVDYAKHIKVSPQFDTVIANACASYSYNKKAYTTSGIYQDTVVHFANCSTYTTLYVNVNDTNANRVSINGLIRYWTGNSDNFGRDIVHDDTLSLIGTGVTYGLGRNGVANHGITFTNTTSAIQTNIPQLTTASISFWYFHTVGNVVKTLIGSNVNTVPAGYPTLLVNNSNLRVITNTGIEVSLANLGGNTWNHIVLVRNGSNYKLYLNGQVISEGTNLATSNFDRIGNNRPNFATQGATGGRFDDIFIYNRELTSAEVAILNSSNSLLNVSKPIAACAGSSASVSSQFQFAGGWKYSVWRGNTKLSDTTFANIPSLTLADTSSIVIKAFSNCRIIEYPVKLNVSNQTADLNNGLLRFWAMKNTENRNSLTNGQSPYSITGAVSGLGLGRNNLDTNGAVQITDKNNQWINTDLTTTELQNGQPYTVSFWLNSTFTNQGAEEGILISNSNASSVAALQLSISNQLQVLNNAGQAIYSSANIPAGVWYHIVYANNGGGYYKLFVNGQIASEGSGTLPNWRPERIGNGRPALTNRGVRGRYDDVMIYNRVITNAEAVSIYNMPAIISTPVGLNTCNNNLVNFKWDIRDTTTVSYTFYKNANTAFVDSTSLSFLVVENDSTVGMKIDKACSTIKLISRINKSTINLNANLERFWTMNAKDAENTLAANSIGGVVKFVRSEPNSMVYTIGRAGTAQSAVSIGLKSSFINPGTAGLTNTTVSFWYRPNPVFGVEANRVLLSGTTSPTILIAEIAGSEIRLRPIGTNDNFIGTAFYTLTAGVYHHIVFVRNGINYEVYVNDTLRLSGTGISQNNIGRIGNIYGTILDRGALGNFDDIAIYSRAITRDEVNALFNLPSITNIPDTSVICAGASRNFVFAGGNNASYRLVKNIAPTFTQTVELDANGTSGTTTVLSGDRIALIQQLGCAQMQYNFYPNVQGTTSVGPTLTYDAVTKRITATSTFNQSRLFRNGVLVQNNTNTGNINYLTTLRCGSYFAEYVNTGSSCPSTSPTLVIIATDTFNQTASLCTGKTIMFGNQSITTPGVYYHTFSGVLGNCDSTVKLTVINSAPTASTLNRTGCGSLIINGKTYNQTGQYKDTITNVAGCDSVITLNLTINSGGPSIRTFNISTCNQYVLNNKNYTQSGTYRDTLMGASTSGCDSILVLNLTLNKNGLTQNITACKNYVFNGQTLTQSGVYYDTLTNAASCDSIITLNLTINSVDVNVTKEGNTLTATESGATYQWINCATNMPISGANAASYTATTSGNYKVAITKNSCIDTSICYTVNIVSCNASLTYTNLSNDSVRCKQIRVNASNVTLPITLNISWASNPSGNTIVVNDSVRVYTDVCPGTYTVKLTDANGCKDSIVFMINEPVGLNNVDANNLFVMYPNPASNMLELNFTHQSNRTITVTDVQGKVYMQFTSNQTNQQIDISTLPQGFYFIRVDDENGVSTKKLIKQ